ncbi:c-type heme family protein [Thalassoroseus pseudoceratinae]|uniref:c-type heme family protein n=1 Tax=Thalassoroseus pseudoceratinae TaxID=2713176 RepID=UPI0014227B24|nr:DUF3365 domain-containing protein [Thalassoroseus pseudoceratinae]
MKKSLVTGSLIAVIIAAVAFNLPGQENVPSAKESSAQKEGKRNAGQKPRKAAVKRTREVVKALDDIYKRTIVLITDKYVHDTDDFAAGSAAVLLFKQISTSEFQDVRLIDATGEPYEDANVAKSEFEKQGLKALKDGKSYYEKVAMKDGKPYLQALTPVPVVLDKCIMCHPHYEDAKKNNEIIGAISYELPIK